MIATRRIIPRDHVLGALVVARAIPDAPNCGAAIKLDGTRYRCGRSVRSFDRQHDGILPVEVPA